MATSSSPLLVIFLQKCIVYLPHNPLHYHIDPSLYILDTLLFIGILDTKKTRVTMQHSRDVAKTSFSSKLCRQLFVPLYASVAGLAFSWELKSPYEVNIFF
jgi:hypothetical protein